MADEKPNEEKPLWLTRWLGPVVYLSNNLISLLGVILTTTGGVSWLFLLPVYVGEAPEHPYLGILVYMVVPGVFFAGLALIPLGIVIKGRSEKRDSIFPSDFPPLDFENPAFRKLLSFIAVATVVNVVIGGHFTYAGVEYMDSTNFCGQSCHSVMTPEFTAYQDSVHFRVNCTECHIGAGASWFVRSKLSGVRQVFATALDTYSRPIPTPIHHLRPARETCEHCHWPQKFTGNRLIVNDRFADDEENTHTKTVLMMKIGGGGFDRGIHGFHLDPGVVIEYLSDPSRLEIPRVSYTDISGKRTDYAIEGWDESQAGQYEARTMDCLDCHNRPSHTFELAGTALDRALGKGLIDSTLPMIKATGLRILEGEFASSQAAADASPAQIEEFYRTEYPEVLKTRPDDVIAAGLGLLAIYQRNVFPEMNVTWGTYPNHIGHENFPGCFRCHDDEHASTDGTTITQDCDSCHEMLAWEEEEPEILTMLGLSSGTE